MTIHTHTQREKEREREREREREFGLNAMCKASGAWGIIDLLENGVAVMVDEFIGLNEFGIF